MILIFTEKISNRKSYIFNEVFIRLLGLTYQITHFKQEFNDYRGVKLNYSLENLPGPRINPGGLVDETGIVNAYPEKIIFNSIPLLYPTDCELNFDPFSAIFFMLSRYEEYMPFKEDRFNRFPAVQSFAFKHNFIELPVVNIWVDMLGKWLKSYYPNLKFKERGFNSIPTYDIDVAYAYRGRGSKRNILAIGKDISTFKVKNLVNRLKTLLKMQKDPWDVYFDLRKVLIENNLEPVYFFLLGKRTSKDKNLDHDNKLMVDLIKECQTYAQIGIHPSFKSYLNPELIYNEKEKLESITLAPVYKSRQHFLRLKIPETYKYLLQSGIKDDYTMGFADHPGFRAGICTPFSFYDLNSEIETDLLVYPLTVMEASLFKYQKLSIEEADKKISELITAVYKVNGMFISLWHNDSISESASDMRLKMIHDKMINNLGKLMNKSEEITAVVA